MIKLILHKDALQLFQFLKDNPTKVYSNGDYFSFLYYEPPHHHMLPFTYPKVRLSIIDKPDLSKGWIVSRNYPIAIAKPNLLEILGDLERYQLLKQRQGHGLMLDGWLLDIITTGIYTSRDTAIFIKLMFLSGYDFEQVIGLFSAISKRKELARYFIELSHQLYKGVAIG